VRYRFVDWLSGDLILIYEEAVSVASVNLSASSGRLACRALLGRERAFEPLIVRSRRNLDRVVQQALLAGQPAHGNCGGVDRVRRDQPRRERDLDRLLAPLCLMRDLRDEANERVRELPPSSITGPDRVRSVSHDSQMV
jgi:hypothetical protein